MDTLTREQRSWNMSRIRGRDTGPELAVRSALHRLGFRFRINVKSLPGRPDIVLSGHRTVVVVHGCFWHRHGRCAQTYTPKSNVAFWQKKFSENVARDLRVKRDLRRSGWRVVTIWACETVDTERLTIRLRALFRNKPRKSI